MATLDATSHVNRCQAVGQAEEGLQRLHGTLELLGTYQQQLDDPRISLKQMVPVVRALETEIGALARLQESQALPADLATLALEVALTAQVEVSKFHRGDYVAG